MNLMIFSISLIKVRLLRLERNRKLEQIHLELGIVNLIKIKIR